MRFGHAWDWADGELGVHVRVERTPDLKSAQAQWELGWEVQPCV